MSTYAKGLQVKFGTDGIRGVAGLPPLVPDVLRRIAAAAAQVIRAFDKAPQILLARDTRESGEMIQSALCEGFCATGCQVYLAGVFPTPAAAIVTAREFFDACVVITASHNPWQDNGVKFFNSNGYKFDEQQQNQLEQLLCRDLDGNFDSRVANNCRAQHYQKGPRIYQHYLAEKIGINTTFTNFKIVLDCANGASFQIAPQVLRAFGAEVICVACDPDGKNINQECGSLYPEKLCHIVLQQQAHLGIALDGDADRVVLVDESGSVLDGDDILAVLATNMLEKNTLEKKTVVATVMSNLGLEQYLKALGVTLIRTAVGDQYVIQAMKEGNFALGGEQSGHIIIGADTPTGDGLLTSLHVMRIMKEKQQPLSQLRKVLQKFPQKIFNIPVSSKPPIASLPQVSSTLRAVEEKIQGKGRVLLRYSGTENKLRLMLEVRPGMDIDSLAAPVLEAIRNELAAN